MKRSKLLAGLAASINPFNRKTSVTPTENNQPPVGVSNFAAVSEWLARAGKTPGNQDHLSVQIGVDMEETAEFLRELSLVSSTGISHSALEEVASILSAIGRNLKAGHVTVEIHDREAALDALCDRSVTGDGVAFLARMQKEEGDRRVIASLFDKFNPDGTPVILEGGKVGKRAGWVAPSMADLV